MFSNKLILIQSTNQNNTALKFWVIHFETWLFVSDFLIRAVLNDSEDGRRMELETSEKVRETFKDWTKKLLQLVLLHTTTSASNPSSEVSCTFLFFLRSMAEKWWESKYNKKLWGFLFHTRQEKIGKTSKKSLCFVQGKIFQPFFG